ARLACLHRDPEAVAQGFEDLRLDEGESTAGSRLVGEMTAAERVTISFDPDSADEPDPADGAHRFARARGNVNGFDAPRLCFLRHLLAVPRDPSRRNGPEGGTPALSHAICPIDVEPMRVVYRLYGDQARHHRATRAR